MQDRGSQTENGEKPAQGRMIHWLFDPPRTCRGRGGYEMHLRTVCQGMKQGCTYSLDLDSHWSTMHQYTCGRLLC